ncbi:MAG: mannose-6-phosphate isomerase, class I [Ilumatobacteraceae bacterium]
MERVAGVVQRYAWGNPTAIPDLIGVAPDGEPWAELWLGTHPGGPAALSDGRPLTDITGDLPYLLKVLAASQPLSLQTHPSPAQAVPGFDREDAAGIDIDSAERIYKDRSGKPEVLCAITPFRALCGFRPVAASIEICDQIGAATLADALHHRRLADVVAALYRRELDASPIIEACRAGRSTCSEASTVAELADRYPDDPSVAVALLLNLVELQDGDAIFLGPGNLHAYLLGTGIEVMSASDNVVRGGMTTKHVDVEELLRVLVIEPLPDPRCPVSQPEPGVWRYDTPDTPFRLWRWIIDGHRQHTATGRELLICTEGDTDVLRRGETVVLLPGDVIELTGNATVFRIEERAFPI